MRHRSWEECRADADAALESGEYEQAEILWLEAFEISRHFEEGDPRQCLTMESLAETFWKGAKYADAIDICHVLLPIYERRLGNDHIDVATIITNLGMLNHALKNFDRAEAHYKRSLQILMGKTGPAPPELTRVITNYALMLCSTGRTAEGEALKARVRRMNTGKWNRVGYFEALKVEEPASFTDTVGEQAQYLQKLD